MKGEDPYRNPIAVMDPSCRNEQMVWSALMFLRCTRPFSIPTASTSTAGDCSSTVILQL